MSRTSQPTSFVAGQSVTTIRDVLELRAWHNPDRIALRAIEPGIAEQVLSYSRLHTRAQRVAALLQRAHASGKPVLLMFAPGLDYAAAFYGCCAAGAIAVPAAGQDTPEQLSRLRAIARDCAPPIVLCADSIYQQRAALIAAIPQLAASHWVGLGEARAVSGEPWIAPISDPNDVCILQYTAGATGAPKGVAVSHASLLANLQAIEHALDLRSGEDEALSWLAPDHEMGLLAGMLSPVYSDVTTTLCPPDWFTRKPERWLAEISARRITVSGGPSTAYDACCQRAELAGTELDLSCWRTAFCSSDALHASTLEHFVARFGRRGFRASSFVSCYGTAESTPVIATTRPARAIDGIPDDVQKLSSGSPTPRHLVLIVDPVHETVLPDGQIGEVWIHGPSVAAGYRGRPSLTQARFHAELECPPPGTPCGPYLRSGDAGYASRAGLQIVGRLSDSLQLHGSTFYAETIEQTARACHPTLECECSAAFSVELEGQPRLVLIHELDQPQQRALRALVSAAVAEQHGLAIHDLIFVPRGELARTSSGKIRRQTVRRAYLNGQLQPTPQVIAATASWSAQPQPDASDRLSAGF